MGDKEFASKVKGAVLNVIKNERRQGGSLRWYYGKRIRT